MKIYLIGLYADREESGSVRSILVARASKSAAIDYVKREIERFRLGQKILVLSVEETEPEAAWSISYHYNVPEGDRLYGKEYEWIIRIEETDLDGEDVPEDMKPELENRCTSLEHHNDLLKANLAALRSRVITARTQLAFYDGGVYESRDRLLSGIHAARATLKKCLV